MMKGIEFLLIYTTTQKHFSLYPTFPWGMGMPSYEVSEEDDELERAIQESLKLSNPSSEPVSPQPVSSQPVSSQLIPSSPSQEEAACPICTKTLKGFSVMEIKSASGRN